MGDHNRDWHDDDTWIVAPRAMKTGDLEGIDPRTYTSNDYFLRRNEWFDLIVGFGFILAILALAAWFLTSPANSEPIGTEVWIIVQKREDGVIRRYLDERRPSIASCLQEANDILQAAADHPGEYEMSVRCTVAQRPKDPA